MGFPGFSSLCSVLWGLDGFLFFGSTSDWRIDPSPLCFLVYHLSSNRNHSVALVLPSFGSSSSIVLGCCPLSDIKMTDIVVWPSFL